MKSNQIIRKCITLSSLMCICASTFANESVWRYVDEQTGKVMFSNVPIKGKKGERIQTYTHPPVVQRQASAENREGVAPSSQENLASTLSTASGTSGSRPVPPLTGDGSVIPDSLLKQLGLDGKKMLPALPKGLPPLPQSLGTMNSSQASQQQMSNHLTGKGAGKEQSDVSSNAKANPPQVIEPKNEPSWAKSVPPSNNATPSWARDPFAQGQ